MGDPPGKSEEARIHALGIQGSLVRLVVCVAALGVTPLLAQTRQAEEARREALQKVDQIFTAMGVQSAATVADVGAGDGFFC
jgi:predicted methyltransferase